MFGSLEEVNTMKSIWSKSAALLLAAGAAFGGAAHAVTDLPGGPSVHVLWGDMKKGPYGKFAVDVDNGFEAKYSYPEANKFLIEINFNNKG